MDVKWDKESTQAIELGPVKLCAETPHAIFAVEDSDALLDIVLDAYSRYSPAELTVTGDIPPMGFAHYSPIDGFEDVFLAAQMRAEEFQQAGVTTYEERCQLAIDSGDPDDCFPRVVCFVMGFFTCYSPDELRECLSLFASLGIHIIFIVPESYKIPQELDGIVPVTIEPHGRDGIRVAAGVASTPYMFTRYLGREVKDLAAKVTTCWEGVKCHS